jgi:hypothetical protein
MAMRLTILIHAWRCEEISPPTSKAYPVKKYCLAQACGLGRRDWWDCDGCYWLLPARVDDIGESRAPRPRARQYRGRCSTCAVLHCEGPARSRQGHIREFLAEASSYSRSDMVIKAGWATVGGETSPTTLWRVLVRTSSPAPRPTDCTSITVPAVAFEEKPSGTRWWILVCLGTHDGQARTGCQMHLHSMPRALL